MPSKGEKRKEQLRVRQCARRAERRVLFAVPPVGVAIPLPPTRSADTAAAMSTDHVMTVPPAPGEVRPGSIPQGSEGQPPEVGAAAAAAAAVPAAVTDHSTNPAHPHAPRPSTQQVPLAGSSARVVGAAEGALLVAGAVARAASRAAAHQASGTLPAFQARNRAINASAGARLELKRRLVRTV